MNSTKNKHKPHHDKFYIQSFQGSINVYSANVLFSQPDQCDILLFARLCSHASWEYEMHFQNEFHELLQSML